MPAQPVSLGVRSNKGRDGTVSAARLINCYAEDAGEEGRIRFPIYASDGLTVFSGVGGSGAVEAMLNLNDESLYVVSGRVVYKVNTSGMATPIGGFEVIGNVFMARNRKTSAQIGIVSGGQYFIIASDVISQINDADLPAPTCITSIDGYFVLAIADGRYFITAIDEGTTIDGLDFAVAEANPDGLNACATRGRELLLFGPRSIEFHTNTGNADFPFERVQAINIGCWSAGSVCESTFIRGESSIDTVIFAATDAQGAYAGIMTLNGYSGAKISNHDVDRSLQAEPDKDSIRSFTWSAGGHTFYCITGSTFTWVYDTVTDFWHERKSHGLSRWRVSTVVTFNGVNIAGDYDNGSLYTMSHTAYDEAGSPLIVTVQPPAVHAWPNPLRFFALHIDVIPGAGLNSTETYLANPSIMVTHSNDGGETWSSERHAVIGPLGKRKIRVKLNRLGRSKEDGKVFKISCSAAVMRGFVGMAVETQKVGE